MDDTQAYLTIVLRAECHSLIVKSLKTMGLLNADTKNVRLDFIFT